MSYDRSGLESMINSYLQEKRKADNMDNQPTTEESNMEAVTTQTPDQMTIERLRGELRDSRRRASWLEEYLAGIICSESFDASPEERRELLSEAGVDAPTETITVHVSASFDIDVPVLRDANLNSDEAVMDIVNDMMASWSVDFEVEEDY